MQTVKRARKDDTEIVQATAGKGREQLQERTVSRDLAKDSGMIGDAEVDHTPQGDVYEGGDDEHDTALDQRIHEWTVLAGVVSVVWLRVWRMRV